MKNLWWNAVIAVGLAVFSFSQLAFSEPANTLTLKEAIEKAVVSNPEVQVKFHQYKEALQQQKIAKGGYWPSADIVSTFRAQERTTPNFNDTDTPNSLTQLVIRQMLFDGFATRSEIARLDHAALVSYYELQNVIQSISLELASAYIDILRYRQLLDYAQDNYIEHKVLFDRIDERVGAGVARRVDLEQASGRLALAEANLLTETTNLQNVTARFQRLYGELPPDNLVEVDFYKDGIPPTASEALQLAYKQNPQLLSAIENIVASQQQIKGAQAAYLPRLDLQARKNLDVSSNGRNSSLAADSLELTATFNLFNGFADKARIGLANERLNTSLDLRDKACVDTRQTLVIAYNDVLSLKEQLGYRNQHQLSIEKAREAYRKQFDIGQRTLLDLLDTENEYFQAKRSYANTERDLATAYARTYAGEGDLLNRLGVTRADLPDIGKADYTENYAVCQAVAPEMIKVNKAAIVQNAKPSSSANDLMQKSKPALTNQALANQGLADQPGAAGSCSADAITARVNDWASAWRHKDFTNYMNFYSKNFTPQPPLNKAEWQKQRQQRIVNSGKINVELSNLKVTCAGNKATASFDQDYSVTNYKLKKSQDNQGCEVCNAKRIPIKTYADKVKKELQFEKNDGQWQILQELVK